MVRSGDGDDSGSGVPSGGGEDGGDSARSRRRRAASPASLEQVAQASRMVQDRALAILGGRTRVLCCGAGAIGHVHILGRLRRGGRRRRVGNGYVHLCDKK